MSREAKLIEDINVLTNEIRYLEIEARDPESWEHADEIDEALDRLRSERGRLRWELDDLWRPPPGSARPRPIARGREEE